MSESLQICHLNGHLLSLAEARIDPLDRGFLFGDALYEGIKVLGGTALFLEAHLDRLRAGLERIEIPVPEGLQEACHQLVEACELGTGFLYLQVTRGVAPRMHIPPLELAPTVLILASRPAFDPPAGRPQRLVTVPDCRWQRNDLKTTSLMGTVLGKLEARRTGADEVVFVGAAGELREGGSTNLFVRVEDRLETHPLDGRILPGVTRAILLKLAAQRGLPVVERAPRMAKRERWREVFVCGTLTGVQPVIEIDAHPVAGGVTGEWTRQLAAALTAHEQRQAR